LINDKVSKNKLKVYRNINNFFLVDSNNEYLGHIEFRKVNKVITITESNSDISRGFYAIMFNIMLSEDDIEEIISDSKLSTQAINSYIKLANSLTNQILSIKVKNVDGTYTEVSKENIKTYGAVISVKETREGLIKEQWREFEKRYNTIDEITGSRSSWGNTYEIGSADIDKIMFLTEISL